MQLRRQLVIPGGFRQGRVLVRLVQEGPETLALFPARGLDDATHQVVDACGLSLLTHLSERDPVLSAELMQRNCWEPVESLALLAVVRPGLTVVDAGAHVGYFAALLARALGPAGHVLAVEPEAENHLLLTANALLVRELFPQAAPITVFRRALAERDGTARLHLFEQNRGLHSLVNSAGAARSVEVETAALDSLCLAPEGRPPTVGRPVDLLKADTQGSELALLRGAEQMLARDRPFLCLEFEPYLAGEERCADLVRWLDGHGYGAFRLFHANAPGPYQAVSEWGQAWTADEVIDQVRRKAVGPYGTLFAVPAAPQPPSAPA